MVKGSACGVRCLIVRRKGGEDVDLYPECRYRKCKVITKRGKVISTIKLYEGY